MIQNFSSQTHWFDDKVPSPTGSDDSGLGWSPDIDLGFQLDGKGSDSCFNYIETQSTSSPQSQNEVSSPKFSPFPNEQKPAFDVGELLDNLEQKADENSTIKQPNKKTLAKSNSKKRSLTESSQK